MLPSWYVNLARVVVPYCVYYKDNVLGPTFIMIDYLPILESLFLFILGLFKREKMMFMLSMLLSFDMCFNWLLRAVAFAPWTSRFDGCGDINEMPSVAFQHSTFIIIILQYLIALRKAPVNWKPIMLLYTLAMLSMVARVYIGINRISEMLVGAAIGTAEALVICFIIVRPTFKIKKHSKKDNCNMLFCSFHIEDTIINTVADP